MIQNALERVKKWADLGVQLTELPSTSEYGTEMSELQLLRYCYYRLLGFVADNIAEQPDYELKDEIDLFISAPMGECVTKEIILSFGDFFMSPLRKYCRGPLFPKGYTADDVAGTISSLNGGSIDLLNAAIEDRKTLLVR